MRLRLHRDWHNTGRAGNYSTYLGFDPDDWQRRFLESTAKRIIINTSRQVGKSTTTATKAVHRAKRKKQFILLLAPSERQSLELMRKVNDVLLLDKSLESIPSNKKSEKEFTNGSRILSLPASEKTIRGYSAVDLMIIDEASRVTESLMNTVSPMLAVSDGDLIILSTPWIKSGFFYELWNDDDNEWEKFKVPATECPRLSKEFLEGERRRMGDLWFRREYMCEFVEGDETLFSFDLIRSAFENRVQTYYDQPDQYSSNVEVYSL